MISINCDHCLPRERSPTTSSLTHHNCLVLWQVERCLVFVEGVLRSFIASSSTWIRGWRISICPGYPLVPAFYAFRARLLLSEKASLRMFWDSSRLYFDLWMFLSSPSSWGEGRKTKKRSRGRCHGQYTMPSFISVSLFRSLSIHVGRQLQQNLGLEVYPVSYSSHFDFLYDILLASSWVFEIQYTEINPLLSPGKKYHIVYFFGNYNGLKVTIGHIIR